MSYAFDGRIDDDSYAITYIDEDQGTAVTKGEINGVPFEGSDFSTCTVTITDNGTGSVVWDIININHDVLSDNVLVTGGDTVPVEVVLYKEAPAYTAVHPSIPDTPVVTGDIAIESAPFGTVLWISGSGTITYSSNN